MIRSRPPAKRFPAISVRQPAAEQIVRGTKRRDLRSRASRFRGWILIHASQTFRRGDLPKGSPKPELGKLLGIAQLDDCVKEGARKTSRDRATGRLREGGRRVELRVDETAAVPGRGPLPRALLDSVLRAGVALAGNARGSSDAGKDHLHEGIRVMVVIPRSEAARNPGPHSSQNQIPRYARDDKAAEGVRLITSSCSDRPPG